MDIEKNVPKRISGLCNWENIHIPIFSYKRSNESIAKKSKNISLLLDHITKLNIVIEEMKKMVSEAGARIELFINNTYHAKFDCKKHFILLRNGNLEIHKCHEIDSAFVQNELQFTRYEEYDDIISLIPPGPKTFKCVKMKLKLIRQLYEDFVEKSSEMEAYQEDLQNAIQMYDALIDSMKDELQHIPAINIKTGEVAKFDINLHDIVAIKNKDTIEILYTRRQDRDQLVEEVMHNLITK